MILIDADALEKQGWIMHRTVAVNPQTTEMQTKKPTDFPTIIDAVPVVRCKDCRFWESMHSYCPDMMRRTEAFGFCAWGERKDDGE